MKLLQECARNSRCHFDKINICLSYFSCIKKYDRKITFHYVLPNNILKIGKVQTLLSDESAFDVVHSQTKYIYRKKEPTYFNS